jgi:hydroxyacylglutathione hydrolase
MPDTGPAAEIVTIPCLKDNYAFLLHDPASGATAAIDVPEAAPIEAVLAARGWRLTDILITHHHWDHVDGVAALRAATGARVWGAAADAHRLPPLDHAVSEGDQIPIGTLTAHVIDVSGHTIGHIALHVPKAQAVFTADSLMAMGCGRLFEGTAAQMWDSLQKLAALPPETRVFSGHEYTMGNARFALTIEPGNRALISRLKQIETARADDQPTVPSVLADELATNPFLRAADPAIARHLGLEGQPPADVFARIRSLKDSF